ncbi:MAG TPA: UbiA family prenyltransferase, partial [Acidobacteriota bacterium]|nr:UbiA family prenyltransferase [Acidobacteriota bacterium]
RLTAIASVALAYSISIPFLIITVAILANTTIYTLYLKKIPYLEMASIATNFVLRVVSGCYIIFEQGQFLMQPTHWLIWMPFLYSIYFVLVKRTLEKKQHSNRYVLQFYSEKKLHIYTFIVTTLVTISYFIYSFYATHTFFWITLPFFTLLLFHVSRIIISNRNEHILNTRCKLLITLYGLSLLCAVHILPKMLL